MHGHQNPERYPLGKLLAEARLTRDEVNRHLATQAILYQLAIGSWKATEIYKSFEKTIEGLINGK